MSGSTAHSRRNPLYPGLIVTLGCVAIAAAAWTIRSTSALAPISNLKSAATPTQRTLFGYVEIGKPTYTALPTIIPSPTFLPTEIPTTLPEQTAYAEIVQDTPTPAYVEQATQESNFDAQDYSGNKRILVDISEQHMYAYDGDTLVFSFVSSTGMNNSTRVGSFSVLDKIPNAYGATWNIWMPNWMGIYWAGGLENGIHALPILPSGIRLWAGYLGVPISYGCVVIGVEESQLLYDWAEIGTPVDIQW